MTTVMMRKKLREAVIRVKDDAKEEGMDSYFSRKRQRVMRESDVSGELAESPVA